MQEDFHYYATYCASYLAGYSHREALDICYSAQFVDLCSRTYLNFIHAPLSAATTQLQLEMMEARTDKNGLQDITRIWSSFHFLPYDLEASPPFKCGRRYRDKYRMICRPNGALVKDTVENARSRSLQAVGIAIHVLADTWAHQNFAGTPSLAINNTNDYFFEILPDGTERPISLGHNPTAADDPEEGKYTGSIFQLNENSIMNLGHGRAGHLPDYSFARYRYLPAWGSYEEILKDNPSDDLHAFTQMIHAMKDLRGTQEEFCLDTYDMEAVAEYRERIETILRTRQIDACADWKKFGEELSGEKIPEFDPEAYSQEYAEAGREGKNETFLGKFILAALAHKSLVTNKIFRSGNRLAGISVDYEDKGFRGIRDYRLLMEKEER